MSLSCTSEAEFITNSGKLCASIIKEPDHPFVHLTPPAVHLSPLKIIKPESKSSEFHAARQCHCW